MNKLLFCVGFSTICLVSTAEAVTIRLQLTDKADDTNLTIVGGATLIHEDTATAIASGNYRISLQDATPAHEQYRLFIRAIPERDRREAEAIAGEWKLRGFDAVLVPLGHRYETPNGRVLDNRMIWVTIGAHETEDAANNAKTQLNNEGYWPWVRRERTQTGAGTLVLTSATGDTHRIPLPCSIRASSFVRISGAIEGTYQGDLSLAVSGSGAVELYEEVALDNYLAGVLPSEMPALWPIDALKAQAITARSDVLAHRGMKHALEGFDFTVDELNRVYKGMDNQHPNTDRAIAETQGIVLTHEDRIVPAVFSADCGGWTANNDTVWSAPPDPALRNRPDSLSTPPSDLAARLTQRSDAYCAVDTKYFRWAKQYSQSELSRIVNQRHKVGRIESISLGARGPSGRLVSVRVKGSEGSATIGKEYPIRLAFGGLPSAMFILDKRNAPSGEAVYTFTGGGRGHGVGLCQHGAKGMANQGHAADAILAHYFSASKIEKVW